MGTLSRCLAVSPAEDQLALLLESGPAFTLSLLNQVWGVRGTAVCKSWVQRRGGGQPATALGTTERGAYNLASARTSQCPHHDARS